MTAFPVSIQWKTPSTIGSATEPKSMPNMALKYQESGLYEPQETAPPEPMTMSSAFTEPMTMSSAFTDPSMGSKSGKGLTRSSHSRGHGHHHRGHEHHHGKKSSNSDSIKAKNAPLKLTRNNELKTYADGEEHFTHRLSEGKKLLQDLSTDKHYDGSGFDSADSSDSSKSSGSSDSSKSSKSSDSSDSSKSR